MKFVRQDSTVSASAAPKNTADANYFSISVQGNKDIPKESSSVPVSLFSLFPDLYQTKGSPVEMPAVVSLLRKNVLLFLCFYGQSSFPRLQAFAPTVHPYIF